MVARNEEFFMYRLAIRLKRDYFFHVLLMDEDSDEIWLEKRVGKKTQIVRLLKKGFDWKNHLKQDVAKVFQAVQAAEKLLANQEIEIHNVYVAAKAPLDDWEIVKKPMRLKHKKPILMHVYYMDQTEREMEQDRLQSNLHISRLDENEMQPDNESQPGQWKQELKEDLQQRESEEKRFFGFGKPILTYLLLAINIIMFLFMEFHGGSQSTENLIRFGAKDNVSMIDGQWWRLLTSMFLHIGFLHLFMNMFVLYYLGAIVERMYGSLRFFLIYIVAGLGGAITSFAFNMNVSAGASGAIFGLFGALLCFGLYHRHIFLQSIGQNIIFLLLINLVYGFFVSGVDVQAHLGGLAGGFLAAMIVQLPKQKKYLHQLFAFIITIVLFVAVYNYGISKTKQSASYEWEQVNTLMQKEDYSEVITHATKGIDKAKQAELKGALLFKRAYAYTSLNQTDKAINDYENSIQVDPDIAESYFNLALLYLDEEEIQKAKTAAKKAHKLVPENKDFKKLYGQLKD